jgi:hypothetical protein
MANPLDNAGQLGGWHLGVRRHRLILHSRRDDHQKRISRLDRSRLTSADIRRWLIERRNVVIAQVPNESENRAAGFNTDSLWDICRDVTQDTAVSLRRLVFSYQRSALERSPLLPIAGFWKFESALRNTIVSSSA